MLCEASMFSHRLWCLRDTVLRLRAVYMYRHKKPFVILLLGFSFVGVAVDTGPGRNHESAPDFRCM